MLLYQYDNAGNVISVVRTLDTDGDGTPNNQDTDDDNDGVLDGQDKFPLNLAASKDYDNDGKPDEWNSSCNTTWRYRSAPRNEDTVFWCQSLRRRICRVL